MTGNKITEWQHEQPTEPGLYLYCSGDVWVVQNTRFVNFRLGVHSKLLEDEDGDSIHYYPDDVMWARLLLGSDTK